MNRGRGRSPRRAAYHHFSDKVGLFQAVFEQVEWEVSDRAVAAFSSPIRGMACSLDASFGWRRT